MYSWLRCGPPTRTPCDWAVGPATDGVMHLSCYYLFPLSKKNSTSSCQQLSTFPQFFGRNLIFTLILGQCEFSIFRNYRFNNNYHVLFINKYSCLFCLVVLFKCCFFWLSININCVFFSVEKVSTVLNYLS